MASPDQVDVATSTDVCAPWCRQTAAAPGILDRLAAGVGDVEELA